MNFVSIGDFESRPTRDSILTLIPNLPFRDDEEREQAAFLYWDTHVREHIRMRDYDGAWHCIQFALEGKNALTGPDGICRGNAEGYALGLLCSPLGVMEMVHVLYYALRKHEEFSKILALPVSRRKWGEHVIHDNRVAKALFPQHGMLGIISGNLALAIANWANSHRRLCPTVH